MVRLKDIHVRTADLIGLVLLAGFHYIIHCSPRELLQVVHQVQTKRLFNAHPQRRSKKDNSFKN